MKNYQNLFSMQKLIRIYVLAALLFLLVLHPSLCQQPEYIHKIPLRLSNNYVYYANLTFGSRNQLMELQLDTGSSTMAIFCDICERGCVLSQQFRTKESSSFKSITCKMASVFTQNLKLAADALQDCLQDCTDQTQNELCKGELNYGSSNLGSYLDYDLDYEIIGIPNNNIKVVSTFGCIYKERNFQKGIWGLSYRPENEFLDAVYNSDAGKGLPSSELFTICTKGKDAVMNIGGIDKNYHIGPGVTFRVDKKNHMWWKLVVQDIGKFTINGTVVRNKQTFFGKYGIIIDSGTDINVFPKIIEEAIIKKIDQYCGIYSSICTKQQPYELFSAVYELNASEEFFKALPPLSIEVKGQTLQTPLSNYFWKMNTNRWALGMVQAQKIGFQMLIFSSMWMNNFDIVFDRSESQITMYSVSSCSSPSRMLQTSDDPQTFSELPTIRQSLNINQTLNRLKKKHKKNIEKLNS